MGVAETTSPGSMPMSGHSEIGLEVTSSCLFYNNC